MQTVAIMGAGEIAGATAKALAGLERVEAIRIIDAAATVAQGKALDIRQAGPIEGSDTRLDGTADPAAAEGAAVVVIADRASADGEWSGEAGIEMLRRLSRIAPGVPLVFAGARQRDLMAAALRELAIPGHLLVGTAPDALAGAARALAAITLDCAAADVSLAVVGVPGTWIVSWDAATVGGTPLLAALGPNAMAQLERRVKASWPPGPYALGSAAARGVAAILGASRARLSVFTATDGGTRGGRAIAALPAVLGPAGVRHLHPPALTTRERVDFDTALSNR